MFSYRIIIVIVFVITKCNFVVSYEYECKKQSDCDAKPPSLHVCSICSDNNKSMKPRCVMIYYAHFLEQKTCSLPKNEDCSPNAKLNCSHGFCWRTMKNTHLRTWTEYPMCYCYEGYVGNSCEKRSPDGSTASLTWKYNLTSEDRINAFFPAREREEIFEAVATDYTKLQFFLYGENGFYEDHSGKNISTIRIFGHSKAASFRSANYIIGIKFPYKPIEKNISEGFTLEDNVLGYEATLRVKLISLSGLVFKDYPIKMYVSYNKADLSLKCIAVIRLLNCGEHADFPLNTTNDDYIEIQRHVDYYDDGKFVSKTIMKPECAKGASTSWKIWRIGKKYRESIGESLNEQYRPQIFQNKTYILPPATLQPARYKILHEVWSTSDDGMSSNFAYCHIIIQQLPIRGWIVGSLEKIAYRAQGIQIKVEARDPNIPNGGDLEYKWTCRNLNVSRDNLCDHLSCSKPNCQIYPNELTSDTIYIFNTTVISRHSYDECDHCKSPLSLVLSARVVVKNESEPSPQFLGSIVCRSNCREKVDTREEMVLAIDAGETDQFEFEWFYGKVDESLKATDDIAKSFVKTNVLLINPNTLDQGSRYKIVARVKGNPNSTAEYIFDTGSIEVVPVPSDPTQNESTPMQCNILPENGTKGFELFEINCGIYSNYRFEYYDKRTEEANKDVIFSGRMLGTSFNGKLTNMRLTRDSVYIYVYNRNGLVFQTMASVTLLERNYTTEVRNEIMSDLQIFAELGELSRLLGYISIVPDVISYDDASDVRRIAKTLISAFKQAPPVNLLGDVKLFISTIYNVMTSLSKLGPLELLPVRMQIVASTLYQQASGLNNAIFDKEHSRWLASSEVQVISKCLLDSLMAAVLSRDKKYDNLSKEEVDIYLFDMIKRTTNKVEGTVELLNEILTYRQIPVQAPTSVESSDNNTILWVMINDKAWTISDMVERFNIPVKIPPNLQKDLEARMRSRERLSLQVAYINHNIFWWCKSDVKTNLASVIIGSQYKERRLSKIEIQDQSLNVLLDLKENLTDTIISGVVTQIDPSLPPFDLDMALKVHRLDPEPRSLIHLQFLYPQTTCPLMVFVSEGFRPDYETMKKESFSISDKHPTYSLSNFIKREKRTFLYMTILPGAEVDVGDSVNYTFEISTKVCKLWVQGYWTGQSCQITENTSDRKVECKCSHVSIFAAAFLAPNQEEDPFNNAMLFLTLLDNPLVVSFVLLMLLIFLILLLLMWFLDKHNKHFGCVIILNDNHPNDPYPYLIAVHTGSRFCSGTTANVGVKIHGTESSSRPHVFFCDYRKVLQRNADDWFVIFTPKHLGDLTSIHLWHDNTGYSPDWFCGKIVVYNIEENEVTIFILEQWVALDFYSPVPQVHKLPAAYMDIKDLKSTFLENCVLGLREGHLFLSVISKHPRSKRTRVQRISLLMSCVMIAMLCSVLFYKPPNAETRTDEYEYSIGIKELLVSIQSLIFSFIITSTVAILFKISYKQASIHKTDRSYTLRVRRNSLLSEYYSNLPSQTEHTDTLNRSFKYSKRDVKSKTVYQNFVRILSKVMQTHELTPVTLPSSPPYLKRRTVLYIIAWMWCLTVILASAYFVMLYGLKLGAVNSKKWLTSVVLTMSEDFFLIGPIRIIFMAVLLSIAYRKLYEANVYEIQYNELLHHAPSNTKEYLHNLIERRSLRMYAPLIETYIQEMVRKKKIRHNWWKLLDFLVAACFLFVLNSVIYRLWTSHFYSNENIARLFANSHHPRLESVDLKDLHSIDNVERYLEISFIQAVFSYRWYNNMHMSKGDIEYWDLTINSRMFGLPLLRQLRVVRFRCENLIEVRGYCTSNWNVFDEEKDSFNSGWSPALWKTPPKSPWIYKDEAQYSLLNIHRLRGTSGNVYHTGGYMTTLGPRMLQAEHTLSELGAYNWQDHKTRVIFLELTLYNVNLDMFSHVTLMVEYLVSGAVLPSVQVSSVKGYEPAGIWGLLLVLLFVYCVLRIAYMVNRHGLLHNFSVVSHVLRITVTLLIITCMVLYLLHCYKSERFVDWFHGQEKETYFDFDSFTFVFRTLQIVLSVLLCVVIVMFFKSVRGGRTFFKQVYTFIISLPWICWLTSILILFCLLLNQIHRLLNIVLLNGMMLDIYHFKSVSIRDPEVLKSFTVQLVVTIKTIIYFVLYCLFMMVFLRFSMVAKDYKFIKSQKLNFMTFLFERLLRKRKTHQGKKSLKIKHSY